MARCRLRPQNDTPDAQNIAAFLMDLRARGIQDLNLLRALENVPREIFVPHRFADLARRPISLPLRCGQTLPEPWLAARMIEALAPDPRPSRARNRNGIGLCDGAPRAAVARSAVDRAVSESCDRGGGTAVRGSPSAMRPSSSAMVWRSRPTLAFLTGLSSRACLSRFPKTSSLCSARKACWSPRGLIPESAPGQQIARITRNEAGGLEETPVCPSRLQALLPGEARAL